MDTHQDGPLRLTQTVQKGGCAAKVAATELRKILGSVEMPPPHPELLIDGRHFDDAAVYQLTPDLAMVQTIDFFTPIVDTPYRFGAIAACNALSDVYAMGGKPLTALGVLAFPLATLPAEVISQVMQGASDKIREAGANFVGGHSIDDDTLKFGLSVTGVVHPKKIWSNQGAQSGDVLILTKALGTGTLTAALKRGATPESGISEALDSMAQLNEIIPLLSDESLAAIHAATDITGFGLAGHAFQLAKASGVSLAINFQDLPLLTGAMASLKDGFLTKAHRTNREYTAEFVSGLPSASTDAQIVFDPQTSGGLLLSVAQDQAQTLLHQLHERFPKTKVIGEVRPGSPGRLEFI